MASGGCKCCTVFAKIVLTLLNIFYLLVGLSLSGVAIYVFINLEHFSNVAGSSFKVETIVLLVVGLITILTALLGIIAAVGGLWPLLIIYCFLVLLLIAVQAAIGGAAFYYRGKIKERVTNQIVKFMSDYTTNQSSPVYNEDGNEVLDFIQENFRCCGFEYGYFDWIALNYPYIITHLSLPASCNCDTGGSATITQNTTECVAFTPYTIPALPSNLPVQIPSNYTIPSDFKGFNVTLNIWRRNCQDAVVSYLRRNSLAIGGAAIAVALTQLLAIIFSIGLCVCVLATKQRNRHILQVQEAAYTQMGSFPTETDSYTGSFSSDVGGQGQYTRFENDDKMIV